MIDDTVFKMLLDRAETHEEFEFEGRSYIKLSDGGYAELILIESDSTYEDVFGTPSIH